MARRIHPWLGIQVPINNQRGVRDYLATLRSSPGIRIRLIVPVLLGGALYTNVGALGAAVVVLGALVFGFISGFLIWRRA